MSKQGDEIFVSLCNCQVASCFLLCVTTQMALLMSNFPGIQEIQEIVLVFSCRNLSRVLKELSLHTPLFVLHILRCDVAWPPSRKPTVSRRSGPIAAALHQLFLPRCDAGGVSAVPRWCVPVCPCRPCPRSKMNYFRSVSHLLCSLGGPTRWARAYGVPVCGRGGASPPPPLSSQRTPPRRRSTALPSGTPAPFRRRRVCASGRAPVDRSPNPCDSECLGSANATR